MFATCLVTPGRQSSFKNLTAIIIHQVFIPWCLSGKKKKNLPANVRDVGSNPEAEWSPREQPTPVFLPGKSHGQRSLEGYGPWGLKELDMTWRLNSKQYLAITAAAGGGSTQEATVTSAWCIAIADAAISFW